jgi:uncharacterized protein (TIGR00251 family)
VTGLRLTLRVTPKARRNALVSIGPGPVLKFVVRAPPEKGKANEAVLDLLAEAFCVPRSAVELIRGETGRDKLAFIAGEPAALRARLEELTVMLGSPAG